MQWPTLEGRLKNPLTTRRQALEQLAKTCQLSELGKKQLMKSISGKQISREEAFEGLGDPTKWEAEKKKLLAEFTKRPLKTRKRKK